MGRSGAGIVAILVTLLAAALGFIALASPAWLANATVDTAWEGKVKRVETTMGLWGICINMDFSNEANLIRYNETAAQFSLKDCYAYYTPMAKQIVRIETIMKLDDYDTSICDHFNTNDDRASNAMGAMTGLSANTMHKYLSSTCSSKGKAVLGLASASSGLTLLALILLIFSVVCCSQSVCLVVTCRYMLVVGVLCSTVMTFLVFSQLRSAFYLSTGVSYGLPLYLDFAALFVMCLGVCTVESYEVKVKKAKNSNDTEKKLEEKIKQQNLISQRYQADVV